MRAGATNRRVTFIVLLAGVVVGGLVLLYVRTRDDGPSREEVAASQTSCDRLQTFNGLVAGPGISPPTPTAPVRTEAVADLLTTMGDLEGFVESSPSKVRTDLRTLVSALRAQSADPTAVRAPAFAEARRRLQGYLNDSKNGCLLPAGSGEG